MYVNGFTYGVLTPGLAYLMSCVGSVLGLQSMARARATSGGARHRWVLLGAFSLGGTGIWVMHFTAMLGFTVSGVEIRYAVPMTLLSLLVAVVVVAAGLTIVVGGDGRAPVLLFGGVVTGLGVAAMHYLGMAAVKMSTATHYDVKMIGLSVLIAVAASTAALWATLNIRGVWATIGAALVMGVAVTGMHYTGMAALSVSSPSPGGIPGVVMPGMAAMVQAGGVSANQLLTPLVIGISVSTALILLVVAMAPTERELREEAALDSYTASIRSRR
jgi:NO-binding membrane sensor protein with MHYT domain